MYMCKYDSRLPPCAHLRHSERRFALPLPHVRGAETLAHIDLVPYSKRVLKRRSRVILESFTNIFRCMCMCVLYRTSGLGGASGYNKTGGLCCTQRLALGALLGTTKPAVYVVPNFWPWGRSLDTALQQILTHTHVYTYIRVYIYIYIHRYTHACTGTHTCTHTYIHTHTHMHTYMLAEFALLCSISQFVCTAWLERKEKF